jgi:hypothetical protein
LQLLLLLLHIGIIFTLSLQYDCYSHSVIFFWLLFVILTFCWFLNLN